MHGGARCAGTRRGGGARLIRVAPCRAAALPARKCRRPTTTAVVAWRWWRRTPVVPLHTTTLGSSFHAADAQLSRRPYKTNCRVAATHTMLLTRAIQITSLGGMFASLHSAQTDPAGHQVCISKVDTDRHAASETGPAGRQVCTSAGPSSGDGVGSRHDCAAAETAPDICRAGVTPVPGPGPGGQRRRGGGGREGARSDTGADTMPLGCSEQCPVAAPVHVVAASSGRQRSGGVNGHTSTVSTEQQQRTPVSVQPACLPSDPAC